MFETYNSVFINEDVGKVFSITNDLERWPEMFGEYTNVKVLSQIGKKVNFKITNEQSNSWCSSRIIDEKSYVATAEREDPLFPFKYMQIVWSYKCVNGGTEMIWAQYFDIDEKANLEGHKIVQLINEHSQKNMINMKELIESGKLS
ncbi:SRPBCC family protein [Clostridium beijerinckii]|uniref:Multifunctional cyclase-dehydratase-3-O-methyl transferase TcmN n=1 Tax=Clostridium beijerinckii TaxID=1520 RepID=A0A1S8SJY8_CLOBE|nr:SRPBCC family protein [Clostridium beijerinckii]NRY61547.1 aromatase [Clostridium beijerinckii]OOM65858.1 multifunctional cyclase-dehydratase-3-O-methyl transferase TcmN [Clostridium beijerinckii]